MQVCGIVTEYNPFHNGHQYHITQARSIRNCDCLIAIMSGNFVQRGEPAIIDKWERAACAVAHGVDIVIELPYPYATQSADIFAQGAIRLLTLANVNHMVFGSECNDIEKLKHLSERAAALPVQKKQAMVKSFADSCTQIASNDLLGISYLKALQGSAIQPYTIQRTNSYNELTYTKTIASASAIRHGIMLHQDVHHATVMANKLDTTYAFTHYYPYLQTLLMSMDREDIKAMLMVEEGMEQLLQKNAALYSDMDSFVNACISKRYTRSRIQRTLLHILTQTKKTEIQKLSPLQHLRILAMNDVGRAYLSQLRKQDDLIIASRFNQIPQDWRKIELRATQAYTYPLTPKNRKEAIAKEWQSLVYIK